MKVQSVSFGVLKKINKAGQTYKDFDLKSKTTISIGGKAKYFVQICKLEDFLKVMLYLRETKTKFFVLGGGSNIVFSSNGYSGVVISLEGDFALIEQDFDNIEMGAGVRLSQAIRYCMQNSLGGFEGAVGVPASIGGATYMNMSCFDFEMSKIIRYVVAFDLTKFKITYLTHDDCKFGYRASIFQNKNYIILRVGFELKHMENADLRQKLIATLQKRLDSQPKGHSAGCVFKKISGLQVSKMLDEIGVKGMSIKDAIVSEKHANFVINQANATSQDVHNLVDAISQKFESVYGIKLECEIEFIGE